MGDRLVASPGEWLSPATRAYAYRRKWQRAFAAELLCPAEALLEVLKGDFSDESIEQAAGRFEVSEMAVRTILVNRGLLAPAGLEAMSAVA